MRLPVSFCHGTSSRVSAAKWLRPNASPSTLWTTEIVLGPRRSSGGPEWRGAELRPLHAIEVASEVLDGLGARPSATKPQLSPHPRMGCELTSMPPPSGWCSVCNLGTPVPWGHHRPGRCHVYVLGPSRCVMRTSRSCLVSNKSGKSQRITLWAPCS